MRKKNIAPLKDVVDRLMKAYRLDNKMKELDVLNAWEDMMGTAVARRTEELRVKDEILYLKLNSAVMRDELVMGKQVIIERVNQTAGYKMIKDIWFA